MSAVRIIQIIAGLAGLGALGLGLYIWITDANVINIHMLFGLTVALGLLILSIIATTRKGLRVLGLVGIIYALILPIFGLTQSSLLIGDTHWLIQTLHMLVGIGGMALMGYIGTRYVNLGPARQSARVQVED